MSSVVKKLVENKLMTPPYDFVEETVYEVIMGSVAYGVSNNTSDVDVYAVAVPSKSMVFPHLTRHVDGFGPKPENFSVYQKHHMEMSEKEYDVVVYSLVKYFALCADNNPNMIDSLFVPKRCVIHATDAGLHMRSFRRLFLSKRIFDKLRGYAFKELKALEVRRPNADAKRKASIIEHGYDVKSAYHVVRLMLEAEQVLLEGDLDLERNREQLKHVRRGGYTLKELKTWFKHKELELTTMHVDSEIPLRVDYKRLTALLFECLEMHFGSLDMAQDVDPRTIEKLEKIRRIVNDR